MQAEQLVGLEGLHLEHPAAQTKQVAELESKEKPLRQDVQIPVEQELQPGVQSLTCPLTMTEVMVEEAGARPYEGRTCHNLTAA